ncbi:hypothetical protein AVEN_22842-1 [Araneus ventricosus]|uniref:Uncharacterized protein n=1 Tax=Araneus ventricosus TaxID=182803 RepID=A0A4Y2L8R2_ARAVE|nr:hypothetical protein AVEN_22842-1 [Araneus ventricosus]
MIGGRNLTPEQRCLVSLSGKELCLSLWEFVGIKRSIILAQFGITVAAACYSIMLQCLNMNHHAEAKTAENSKVPTAIMQVIFFSQHGPFPAYLKRFHLSDSDYCSCGGIGTALHYATECIYTVSWHMRKPAPNFEQEWL